MTAVAADEGAFFSRLLLLLLLSLSAAAADVVVPFPLAALGAEAPESRASEILMRSVFERESRVAWAAADEEEDRSERDNVELGERSAAKPTTQATAAAPPSEASGASTGASRPAKAEAQRGARSTSEGEEGEGGEELRRRPSPRPRGELLRPCRSFSFLRERVSTRRHSAASSPRLQLGEELEEQGRSPTTAARSSSDGARPRRA